MMKLLRVSLHNTIRSVSRSSTISNVIFRKKGGPILFKPSIGLNNSINDKDDDPLTALSSTTSSFTRTTSSFSVTPELFFLSISLPKTSSCASTSCSDKYDGHGKSFLLLGLATIFSVGDADISKIVLFIFLYTHNWGSPELGARVVHQKEKGWMAMKGFHEQGIMGWGIREIIFLKKIDDVKCKKDKYVIYKEKLLPMLVNLIVKLN